MKVLVETYGTNISLDTGMLVLETNKHKEEISLLHLSSLHIQTHVRISSAVIVACINSGIPIYFEDQLEIEAMIWSPRFGSISKIRKKQALLSYSQSRFLLIKKLLIRKNLERIALIKATTIKNEILHELKTIENFNEKIKQAPLRLEILRALEANSSKIYFNLYNRLIPKAFRFEKRTYKKSNDVLNVCLNYTYGILYNEIIKSIIIAGMDPDMGFFHVPQYNKPSLSYDLIEPYRAWAEKSVLKTLKEKKFREIEKIIDEGGRLSKKAKHILIIHFETFLQETKILWNKRIKTPQTHIQLDSYQLAQYILNLQEDKLLKEISIQNENKSTD